MGDSFALLLLVLIIPIIFICINIFIAHRMNKKWGINKLLAWFGCTAINVASFVFGFIFIGPDMVNPSNKTDTLMWLLLLVLPPIILLIISNPAKPSNKN